MKSQRRIQGAVRHCVQILEQISLFYLLNTLIFSNICMQWQPPWNLLHDMILEFILCWVKTHNLEHNQTILELSTMWNNCRWLCHHKCRIFSAGECTMSDYNIHIVDSSNMQHAIIIPYCRQLWNCVSITASTSILFH